MVKVKEVREGSTVEADAGFTCMREGDRRRVRRDRVSNELWIKCKKGRHYLQGQVSDDGKYYIGLSLVKR